MTGVGFCGPGWKYILLWQAGKTGHSRVMVTGWKPIPLLMEVSMEENGLFRRRHLPHIDVEDKPYFVTACLEGSLSALGLSKIHNYQVELEDRPRPANLSLEQWEHQKQKLRFKFMDKLLDGSSPVRHFEDDRLAQVVQDAFHHFANVRYHLLAYVVMPSHHHWLFLPRPEWIEQSNKFKSSSGHSCKQSPREVICHSIQSFTANACNKILGTSGSFWQGETFDHFARDEAEVIRIINYIESNPVVAGLVANPEDWKWSSAQFRKKGGIGFQPVTA